MQLLRKTLKAKENFSNNHFRNNLRLFHVLVNFPFTIKQTIPIITYKHGIYEVPHELPNDLRLAWDLMK